MPNNPTKEDVLREFRERGILDGARHLVAQEGLEKLTIDRVAEEAGIAKGTVYLYYKTKDDLLRAVLGDIFDRLTARMREAIASADAFPDQLRAFIRAGFFELDAHQAFFRALIARPDASPPPHDESVVRMINEHLAILGSWFEQAKEAGYLRSGVDPVRSAFSVMSILHGTGIRQLHGLLPGSLEDELEPLIDTILYGIGEKGVQS